MIWVWVISELLKVYIIINFKIYVINRGNIFDDMSLSYFKVIKNLYNY